MSHLVNWSSTVYLERMTLKSELKRTDDWILSSLFASWMSKRRRRKNNLTYRHSIVKWVFSNKFLIVHHVCVYDSRTFFPSYNLAPYSVRTEPEKVVLFSRSLFMQDLSLGIKFEWDMIVKNPAQWSEAYLEIKSGEGGGGNPLKKTAKNGKSAYPIHMYIYVWQNDAILCNYDTLMYYYSPSFAWDFFCQI